MALRAADTQAGESLYDVSPQMLSKSGGGEMLAVGSGGAPPGTEGAASDGDDGESGFSEDTIGGVAGGDTIGDFAGVGWVIAGSDLVATDEVGAGLVGGRGTVGMTGGSVVTGAGGTKETAVA